MSSSEKKDTPIMPKHVAIIMDGNGRWAKKRALPRTVGHQQGSSTLKEIIKATLECGIPYLSVFAFSTENWSRPKEEVCFLTSLFEKMLLKELKNFHDKETRVRIIGEAHSFNKSLQELMNRVEDETKNYNNLNLNLMINYGSRQEMVAAVKSIVSEKPNLDDIDENYVENHLYTAGMPNPDILIRTSGEHRLSNYMLWQASYSELFFTDKLWPDFSKEDFLDIISAYQKRDRRYGGL